MSKQVTREKDLLGQVAFRPMHCIVTPTNAQGQSVVESYGSVPNVLWDPGRLSCHMPWATAESRVPGNELALNGREIPFDAHGGSLLRVADLPPEPFHDPSEVSRLLNGPCAIVTAMPRHSRLHKKGTLDDAPGCVGRGHRDDGRRQSADKGARRPSVAPHHSWSNRFDKVCPMASCCPIGCPARSSDSPRVIKPRISSTTWRHPR